MNPRTNSKAEEFKYPASEEIEKGVLSIMLNNRESLERGLEFLQEEDFFFIENRKLFRAMVDFYIENKTGITIPLLYDYIESKKLEKDIGGLDRLTEIAVFEQSPYAFDDYVAKLKEKSKLRKLLEIGNWILEKGQEEGVVFKEYVSEVEKKIFDLLTNEFKTKEETIEKIVTDVLDKISQLYGSKDTLLGIDTGYYNLNEILLGFQPSDLIIIAARPGMGKTSFALNLCLNMSERDAPVAFFSLEMPKEQLVMRLLSIKSGIPLSKIRQGKFGEDEWLNVVESGTKISQNKIVIDDTPGLRVTELWTKARRMQIEHGIKAVFIDYLQLMRADTTYNSREQEIAYISRSLKQIAKDLNIPVISLSQLNRSLEQRRDKRPILSDLRESGSIEQDADVVLFIYRDEVYNENSQDKGIAEIEIAKHRNGPMGKVKLVFRPENTAFLNFFEDQGYDF